MRRLNPVLFLLICAILLIGSAGCRKNEVSEKSANSVEEVPTVLPMVQVADPKTSVQLIKGFYSVEANSWRWTMGHFSVVLGPPPGASEHGATLVLRFALPEAVVKKVGPVTLSATVNGTALEPETYSNAGDQMYSREVPVAAVANKAVAVDFALDKYLPPGEADDRELGIIVSVIGFEPR